MKKHLNFAAILAASLFSYLAGPGAASADVFVSVRIGPPALPVYVQPPCPTAGYLWTPGYWAYGPMGYYWVPGVWVAPPRVGVLWTPGYWGFAGGLYGWHAGYWGPHVGFYGGVNYGFGYSGFGFGGGVWAGSAFRYNTAVMHVDTTVIHNTYIDNTVIHNTVVNRTSFNGPGGINARPTAQEQAALHEQHFQPTGNQTAHEQAARADRNQFASVNHGTPGVTAMNHVNGRAFNQQGRIAQGIGSGKLTARQGEHLEGREANIHQEVHQDRQANGGHLTPQEHQQVSRQQNNASKAIAKDKHAGAERQKQQHEEHHEPR